MKIQSPVVEKIIFGSETSCQTIQFNEQTNSIDSTNTAFPSNEIVFGIGSGISSSSFFKVCPSNVSMIIGDQNSAQNSQKSAIIGGELNSVCTVNNSAILGGRVNRVTGGSCNSTILGGVYNYMCSDSQKSSIIGGDRNSLCCSSDSSIIGGFCNKMFGETCGYSQFFGGTRSIISGGICNSITFTDSGIISGGRGNNLENADCSSIQGGCCNTIFRSFGSAIFAVSYGSICSKKCEYPILNSAIIGGNGHRICCGGTYGLDTGGKTSFNAIIGGECSTISCSSFSVITGGVFNKVDCCNISGVIIGGRRNSVTTRSDNSSIIGGGYNNIRTNAKCSSIIGGCCNTLQTNSCNSAIIGGAGMSFSNTCNKVIVPSLVVAQASQEKPHIRLLPTNSVDPTVCQDGDIWFDGQELYMIKEGKKFIFCMGGT